MAGPTAVLFQNKTIRKVNSCVTKFRIIHTIICRFFWASSRTTRRLNAKHSKCAYSQVSLRRWSDRFISSILVAGDSDNQQSPVLCRCCVPTSVQSATIKWMGHSFSHIGEIRLIRVEKRVLCVIIDESALKWTSTVLWCCAHGRWIATRWIIATASDMTRCLWRLV